MPEGHDGVVNVPFETPSFILTGKATLIGTFKSTGSKSFTPLSKGDWVLVIDNDNANLTMPGKSEKPDPES
jgi:hypothetical protein